MRSFARTLLVAAMMIAVLVALGSTVLVSGAVDRCFNQLQLLVFGVTVFAGVGCAAMGVWAFRTYRNLPQ